MIKHHALARPSLILAFILLVTLLAGCTPGQGLLEIIDTRSNTLDLWDTGPLTLDPAISSEMASHHYVMQIFSGLVKFDSDLKPEPDIAERWAISQDGRSFIFTLRKDVRFHDGRQVTAQDVKYSFERACNPATGSPTALTYLGDIIGTNDVIAGKADSISGIEVMDENTVRITIDTPKAYFLSKMAYPTAFIVDRKNVESGPRWWKKPNGTGPYRLGTWEEGNLIILEPNKQFYGKKASVRVAFHLLSGLPIRVSLYETGKIDVLEVDKSFIDLARDEEGPYHSQLHVYPQFSLSYLGFNTAKPPFDDIYVRQAFCHATDKGKIISLTQKDMVTPAVGIIPPGMPGYNTNIQALEYDLEKARELLAKSRYGSAANLPPITLTTASLGAIGVSDDMGAILQGWQRDLGVDITVRLLNSRVYQYSLREEADEIFDMGWIADYPDPQNFLDILFHSGADYNYSNFSSKELDDLLDRAAIEQNYNTRIEMYQQAEKIIVNQAPVMPLWFSRDYVLVNERVKGYYIDPLGVPRYNRVTLEN